MTYGYKIAEFERKYIERIENLTGRLIKDGDTWWQYLEVFFDYLEEEEEGPPEWRQQQRDAQQFVIKYIAYLLRNDLDGSWHGHPYPQPVTRRLRKVWPVAELLYYQDDLGQGFYGPSAGELIYLARAISVSKEMGNTDFDDVLPKLSRWKWMNWHDTNEEDMRNDVGFHEWLMAGGFDWMFNHRGTKLQWETRSRFVSQAEAIERGRQTHATTA